jgi:uroporphyrinogen decarboxylase
MVSRGKNDMTNEKFQNALKRKPQAVPPIWMMRQAGRYHKHYQNLRSRHSFMELCVNPELAAQVAMGPIEDFDFDLAILFSDLLFPLQALGMGLEYTEQGPRLGFQLTENDLKKLKPWQEALSGLQFQKEAMLQTRALLPAGKSLIGFVGGPWTLFGYAVEGSHKGHMFLAKKGLSFFQRFNEILLPLLQANIQLQLDGGAEVVMILDTAAGELSAQQFQQQMQAGLLQLCQKFPGQIGYYSKSTLKDYFSPEFLAAPWAGMGFDHRWDMNKVLSWQKQGFSQGNFDQSLLHLPKEHFAQVLKNYLQPFTEKTIQERAGWVCGLGHGILPQTPEENVRTFVKTVRETFG